MVLWSRVIKNLWKGENKDAVDGIKDLFAGDLPRGFFSKKAKTSDGFYHGIKGCQHSFNHWQSFLPDDTQLWQCTIPASHDSGACKRGGDLAVCQSLDILEQLEVGLRCLDIRVDSGTHIHHGGVRQGMTFLDVMRDIQTFLRARPTEVRRISPPCWQSAHPPTLADRF
jgi:hypothetical protein